MVSNRNSFHETEEYKLGHKGEVVVRDLLLKAGWFVSQTYDQLGPTGDKAPKCFGMPEGFLVSSVLPDIDTFRNGERRWVEVKTKTKPTYNRKRKRDEHGINLRHWNDYRIVQKETGVPVFIFVYEVKKGNILVSSVDKLSMSGVEYHGDKMDKDGMIFFDRTDFALWAIVDFEGFVEMDEGNWIVNRQKCVDVHYKDGFLDYEE